MRKRRFQPFAPLFLLFPVAMGCGVSRIRAVPANAPPVPVRYAPKKQLRKPAPAPVHLVAVGDILLAGPMARLMARRSADYPFLALAPKFRRADIVFGNLECCLSKRGNPIPKQFNFEGDPDIAPVLKRNGFTIVSQANNHAWDFGRDALLDTVQVVRAAGVRTVGAGRNRDAAHALQTIETKGMRVGFLAYLGLIPALLNESNTEPCLAMASRAAIARDVGAAKKKVDVLIVSLHAGEEGAAQPTPRQREFAEIAIDSGADMVIGHHPHVRQALEIYHGKPIAYSLGNFVFSTAGRGSGALLEATLFPNRRITARLIPLSLAGGQPHFPVAPDGDTAK